MNRTKDELIQQIQSECNKNGCAVSVGRSDLKRGSFELICDRAGTYRDRGNKTNRNTGTRKTDCPFKYYCAFDESINSYVVTKHNGHHKHLLSDTTLTHPILRRTAIKENGKQTQIAALLNSAVKPSKVMTFLRKEDGLDSIIAKDLYNLKAKERKEVLNGVEALVDALNYTEYEYNVKLESNGKIVNVFFSHRRSIELCNQFYTCFVIDCTYKTNKYKLPLLNIVGINFTYSSFNAGFVFLSDETEESYLWALQQFRGILKSGPAVITTDRELALVRAIETVFPTTINILCIWHINKNILKALKKYFPTNEEFEELMKKWYSYTETANAVEEEYYWDMLSEYCSHYDAEVLSYLETWKEYACHFVKHRIGEAMHLNTRASCRVEGSHSQLKHYVEVSTCDLLAVLSKLNDTVKNQAVSNLY
jgi:hypothetical protein